MQVFSKKQNELASGFTLFESLVTLALFFTFLVASGGLIIKVSRVLRFSEQKSQSLRALTSALDLMTRDIAGAQKIFSPSSGTSNILKLTMVDASKLDRVLSTDGSIPPFPIRVLDDTQYCLTITTSLQGEELVRQIFDPSGGGTTPLSTTCLAQQVSSLECKRGDGFIELKLATLEEHGPRSLSVLVPSLVGI